MKFMKILIALSFSTLALAAPEVQEKRQGVQFGNYIRLVQVADVMQLTQPSIALPLTVCSY